MQPGASVYQTICGTVGQLESEQVQLSSQLSACEQTINQAMTNRARLVSQLAENYMDPKVAANLGGRLSSVTSMLNQMQLAKSQRRTALQGLLSQAKQRQGETAASLTAAKNDEQSVADSLAAKLAEAKAQTEAREDWKALSDKIQRRMVELQAAEKAKAQAEKVLAAKRGGYENNRSFKYLCRRAHSSIFPWIRAGDEWLAGRMDFKNQKARYDRLLARPKLIDNLITASRAEQKAWEGQLQQISDAVQSQLGVPQLKHILEQKSQTRETIDRQARSLATDINTLDAELQGILKNDSPFERNMKSEIANLLNQVSSEQLAAAAAQTETPEDDRIVREIRVLEAQIATAKQSANAFQSQLSEKQTQLTGLHNIRQRFESENYETHRSVFTGGFDISHALMGFVAGQVTESILWGLINNAQSWRSEPRSGPMPSIFDGSGGGGGGSWGNWGGGGGGGGFSGGGGSDFGSSSGGGGGGGGDWSTTGGV